MTTTLQTVRATRPVSLAVQQSDLCRALVVIHPSVSSRPTLPVLSNVLLTVDARGLTLTGYDLEVAIRHTIPSVHGGAYGSVAVPYALMAQFVKTFKEGELQLDFTGEDDLVISGSTHQYTLSGAPGEDYPDVPAIPIEQLATAWQFIVPMDELRRGLNRTLFATAREASRAFTSGLHLCPVEGDGGRVRLVATDGRRLAMDEIRAEHADLNAQHCANIPARIMDHLLMKSFPSGKTSGGELASFTVGERLALIEWGDTQVLTHLLDAQFPDYNKVIPQHFTGSITLSRADLLDAVRVVSLVARQKEGRDMAIMSTDGNRLTITARVDSVGTARKEVYCEQSGTDLKIAFNYQYLADFCKYATCEEVTLKYAGQVDPGCLGSGGSDPYTYVLMPVRLMD